MIKKILGYILMFASLYYAFYRGKKQGELDCIDFNVLPVIANTITIIVCIILMITGVFLLKKDISKK